MSDAEIIEALKRENEAIEILEEMKNERAKREDART